MNSPKSPDKIAGKMLIRVQRNRLGSDRQQWEKEQLRNAVN